MPARAAAVYSTVCWQDTAVRHQSAFRDVRDVVDVREIGKGWWCCSFPLTFPWQQKQHRGVFPSQAGKALLLFQKHPKWVTQGRADSSLQLLLQLCVCPYTLCCVCLALSWTSVLHTHRQRNDTPENETGRERGSCREATLTKKKKKEITTFLWQFNLYAGLLLQNKMISDLTVLTLVVFQGNPLLLPNHHSVSLETKKWHLETYSACVVKTYTTWVVQLQWRPYSPSVINSVGVSAFGSVIEGDRSDSRGERKGEKRDKETMSSRRKKANESKTFSTWGIPQRHFQSPPGFLRVHTPYQACLTELETMCHSKNTFLHIFACSISILPFSYSLCRRFIRQFSHSDSINRHARSWFSKRCTKKKQECGRLCGLNDAEYWKNFGLSEK